MEKRGQVTLFIILGIVILLLAGFFYYLKHTQGFLTPPADFLNSQLKPIQINLEECISKAAVSGLTLLGKQGGSFSPANYRLYQGQRVRYFCQNIPGKEQCLNTLPPLSSITEEFKKYLTFEVNTCVDKTLVDKTSGVQTLGSEKITITTTFIQGIILVEAHYDLTLKKDQASISLAPVKKSFDAPLEELYDTSRDITQAQASTGQFDQLIYMLNKKGAYEITVDKPFPDIIYKINKKNSPYQFWFAIEGESS